jgi:OmpA-OmpF porin, OOP family
MLLRFALSALAISALACASPRPTPIHAPVLTPAAHESVKVDQLIVLVDTSHSVRSEFRSEKALVESFARSMPKGKYETGSIAFGGFERVHAPLAKFDRSRVVAEAEEIKFLDEGTPIHRAISEAAESLEEKGGTAAIVLYSDGEITSEIGREVDPRLALDAVKDLRRHHKGPVCLHAVQIGDDPQGAAFLRSLADATECGSFRAADDVTTVASLQQFQRNVFFGTGIDVAAAPADADRDGVIDAKDDCPGTPRGATVDARGCWQVKGLRFATDSAAIDAKGKKALDEVATVLKKNPKLHVQLGGHTDSTASESHNTGLSDRRAEAARKYLVAKGIDGDRISAKGYGESHPAADNATADGRAKNRRTEIEVID